VLAKIDHTDFYNADIGERYMIEGFPTLKVFHDGNFPTDFTAARTTDDIVEWMQLVAEGKDPS